MFPSRTGLRPNEMESNMPLTRDKILVSVALFSEQDSGKNMKNLRFKVQTFSECDLLLKY